MKAWIFVALALLIPLSSPVIARGRRGRIGERVRLGPSTFVIWNVARTGVMPKGASISPDGKLFVTNFGRRHDDNVSVFRTNPLRFERFYSYPGNAIESAVSADGKWLYVTNKVTQALDVIDIDKGDVIRSYAIGGFPKVVVVDRRGLRAYLSLWIGGRLARVELKTGAVDRLKTGHVHPRGLALSRDETLLFAANNRGRHVTVVDTREWKVKKQIRVPGAPRHAMLSRDGARVYISAMGRDAIGVINVKTLKLDRYVYVGRRPKSIEESYDGRYLYTADYGGDSVSIVDTKTFKVKTLPVDLFKASGLAVHPDDRSFYVTSWCSNEVFEIRRFDGGTAIPGPPRRHPRRRLCRECLSTFISCPKKKRRAHGSRRAALARPH